MKFSLITTTLGRVDELEALMSSLDRQVHKDFELILVDQNDDERLLGLVSEFGARFQVKHVNSKRGISIGRNVGLQAATGEVVAFPDDDCEYPETLLAEVNEFFAMYPEYTIHTCRSVDKNSGKPSSNRWIKHPTDVREYNIFRTAISFTIFFKRSSNGSMCMFNERLGIGAPFGSAEETDFLFRLLEMGNKALYHPETWVYHPAKEADSFDRAFFYGMGLGAFYKIHLFKDRRMVLTWPFMQALLLRPLAGAVLYLCLLRIKKVRGLLYTLAGRWRGLWVYS